MNWQKLTEEFGYDPRDLIRQEFEEFKAKMYKGLSEKERKEYGMVYTPAEISIKMIDKFGIDSLEGKTILDPCCGSGNLLVACLLAGADADKLFGNELNRKMVRLARRRIQAICRDTNKYPHIRNREKFVNLHHHIHIGDATNSYCLTHFGNRYNYNLTTSSGSADSSDDDNAEPAAQEALLTITGQPKTKFSKALYRKLLEDTNYPEATEDEVMTAADYIEVLAEDIPDEEDKLSIVADAYKEYGKAAKLERESKKTVLSADTVKQADLFGGF